MRMQLKAKPPFSLHSTVRSHGWYQMAPFSYDDPSEKLGYTLQLSSGRVVDISISGQRDGVAVSSKAVLLPAERAELKNRVQWMLGLERDFTPFYALAKKEPKLAHMEEKAQGRVLRSATLFEDVIKTILTTNTLWAATKRMNANLITQFGSPSPEDPAKIAFPTPAQLASTDEATLRAETRLGYRAPYVLGLAQSVNSGSLDLESLKTSDLPTLALRKELLAIKGVGGYAAANLLNLLGRYDFLPVDSWALKVVSLEWHEGKDITAKEVEDAFVRWGEWKGLAYWFWDWAYMHQSADQ
jgi:3-methyladenine DNA glycosylase/8-oxoguanine DNA glycosylase